MTVYSDTKTTKSLLILAATAAAVLVGLAVARTIVWFRR